MSKEEKVPEIGLIGMSHKTASIETREQFSLDDEKVNIFLEKLKTEGVEEAVCVSTCNRVEVYFASDDIQDAVETVSSVLEEVSSIPADELNEITYRKYSKDAIQHLLHVSSSLDSLVVGEDEILGQIKDAYRNSVKKKNTGQILNRLFHHAFKTAKRVRTETEIARNPLSVAYISTELAKSIFNDLSKRKALLIGAGEMGELILKYLTKYNISEVTIANRSSHNAERIADELNREARIVTLDDIRTAAGDVDIIVSSVSYPGYIITPEMAKEAVKKKGNKPIFMIDISVPRTIDPEAGKVENIFLYNVDDLKSIADENLKNRLKEVELAKQLIESDANEFYEWYEGLEIVPTIVNIQDRFNKIREKELTKYRRRKLKHISDDDYKLIEELTAQIMTKTLHNPIMYLKGSQSNDKKALRECAKIVEEVFKKRS